MHQPLVTLAHVAAACRRFDIPTSQFGREAIGDPRLVQDLRQGRQLRPTTAARINAYIIRLGGSAAESCASMQHRPALRLASEATHFEHRVMMREGSEKLLAAILVAKGEC